MKPFFVEENINNGSIITIDNPNSQIVSISGCLKGSVGDTALILITPFNSKMTDDSQTPESIQINLTIDAGSYAKIAAIESFYCSFEKIKISVICSPGAMVDLALNGGGL